MTDASVTDDAPQVGATSSLPVLMGLKEMVDLFPVVPYTVYRWNTVRGRTDTNPGTKQLPDPYVTVSSTPLWTEEQILEFAARKGLTPKRAVLNRIRRNQRDSVKAYARS